MSINFIQRPAILLAAALIAVGVGCVPRGTGSNHAELERAIALYIDQQYEQAARDLDGLSRKLESDEDILAAYLYLGRSYEALGDYVSAAEAFSNGRMLGGGVVFEEHLAAVQGHLRATPRTIRTQQAVTRAQVAALTVRLGGITEKSNDAPPAAPDLNGHWAESYATSLLDLGIMEVLPDGRFHPEDAVTVASFYILVLRAGTVLGAPAAPLEEGFPGGFQAVLREGDALVAGGEATDILQAVLARAEH